MKKLVLTFCLLVASTSLIKAQGNLQFNQVINAELTAYVTYNLTTYGTMVVPAGKVWKVETVTVSDFNPATEGYIGGYAHFIDHFCVWSLTTTAPKMLPLWLKEGTYTVQGMGYNDNMIFSYSVIEFNVIP